MTGIDAVLHQPAAQAVGWALLHFVWQGALIGALTALVLLTLRRSAADVRYVVSAIGLALMLTLPVVTGVQTWKGLNDAAVVPTATVSHTDVGTAPSSRVTAPQPGGASREKTGQDDRATARDGVLRVDAIAAAPDPSMVATRLEPFIPFAIAIWLGGVMLLTLRLLTGWLGYGPWFR